MPIPRQPQLFRGVYAEVFAKDTARAKKGQKTGSYIVKWTHLCNGRAKWSFFTGQSKNTMENFWKWRGEGLDWEKAYADKLWFVAPQEYVRSASYEV